MSRSRRKTPICGITTAGSDKWFKVSTHRANRARLRFLLAHGDYENAEVDPPYNDYNTPKDGKQILSKETIKRIPKLMRK